MFGNSTHKSNEPSSLLSNDSPPPKPNSRRLRASCDGCYLSKVKCGKETPTCARCVNHGHACTYSPSQRVGKPRRIREEQQARNGDGPNAATTKPPSSRSASNGSVHPPSYSWNMNFDPSRAYAGLSVNQEEDLSALCYGVFSASDGDIRTVMDDSSYASSIPSPSNSLPTPVDSVFDFPATSKPSPTTSERMGKSIHHQPLQSSPSDELMPLQDDLSQLYYPQFQDLPQLPDQPLPLNCTCTATTFEVLRTLHDQPLNTTFDKVLAANKSAINNLSVVLSCPCSRDATSIMTLAVAITKITSRYQSIGNHYPYSATTTSAVGSPAMAPLPTPITLGAYRLDSAEEEQIKMQVVLNELRKVDGLLGKFQERFGAGPPKHEARIYNELATFLRRKLRDIVEGLQRDLQLGYEGSSF